MIIEIIATGSIAFFVGLVAGAKIFKNKERLEEWARNQLKVIGVPV